MSSIQLTLAALQQNPVIIDNHGNGKTERKVAAVATFTRNGKEHLVMLFTPVETAYFCCNPLSVEADGRVHLSTCSVGPTLDIRRLGGLEEAIADHAASKAAFTDWDIGTFGPVIYL